MDKAARQKLKQFLEDNIAFAPLKKAGFFGKGIRKTDHEKIAARICWFFGFKSIYEYKKACHGKLCDGINCSGTNIYCKNYNPLNPILSWPKVEVSQEDLISQDKYLN